MNVKNNFAKILWEQLKDDLDVQEIEGLIEKPKHTDFGDLAFPCFSLAAKRKMAPQKIAEQISKNINSSLFEKIEVVGPYVNVFLNKSQVFTTIISEILSKKESYGSNNIGKGEVVTIDMSSPNIAKPFSMGHLRSTVIGNAIALIHAKCGFKPIKINHLGDWGTQFGKLIAAYKHWGVEEKVKQKTIQELLALYVKFHEEAENNKQLEVEGREWFKQLEDGHEEATSLWSWFREESLKEFNRIYEMLNIQFDSTAGEAFYNDKMESVVELLENKELLTESDSAKVVLLEDEQLPPCLIKKSDGATLYATRDLAAALYRQQTYQFAKSLYVVGNEQTLHFKQLKAVLQKLEYDWASNLHHIGFGMMLKDGKKMSTRKGEVVFLEDVLRESISLAQDNIEKKNPTLENKSQVAHMVGVGAIVFHDLKNYRMNDIDFSLEDITRFEGETGPYVQYTNARACSILRKANRETIQTPTLFTLRHDSEWELVMLLLEFPTVIQHALQKYDPSLVAKFIVDLAQAFNKYYGEVKILSDDEQKEERIALVAATSTVLTEGLRLLGMKAPIQM
ncbi:arginine--tRNA ligase [Salirhabdus euzebyi]|nr:arginine--tRNA ligase [Salirhabdus euzebyi]